MAISSHDDGLEFGSEEERDAFLVGAKFGIMANLYEASEIPEENLRSWVLEQIRIREAESDQTHQ